MQIFHVTEILGKYVDFSMIPETVLTEACKRGGIVHGAAEAYALGAYVSALPTVYHGYYLSFKTWFDHNVQKVLFVEERLIDKKHGYTGRVDLVAVLINGLTAVIDLKTPATESKTWKVQTAAYANLITQRKVNADICLALKLNKNGGEAKAFSYDNWQEYFLIFLSALNAHRNLI